MSIETIPVEIIEKKKREGLDFALGELVVPVVLKGIPLPPRRYMLKFDDEVYYLHTLGSSKRIDLPLETVEGIRAGKNGNLQLILSENVTIEQLYYLTNEGEEQNELKKL